MRPSLVILTYHSIKTSASEQFKKQMDMLLNTGMPVTLDGDILWLLGKHNIAVTFDDAYQSVLQNAFPILRDKKIPATIFVPTGFLANKPGWIKKADHPYANEILLTEKQLAELSNDMITVGSHTVSHAELVNIDAETFRREISDSKRKLEMILNKRITLISVPYGQFDKSFTELFKEAGYQRVFLNIPTFPATKTDLFVMGRVAVDADDWPIEFRLKLLGAYQWLPLAIKIKSILRKNFLAHSSKL